MDNKFFICENINIFGYLGAWGGGGGGYFNNQTWPILVHIYPLIYIKSNMLSNRRPFELFHCIPRTNVRTGDAMD